MKLRGLVPNSYIHVSVSDLYIHRIGLPISIWIQKNRQTDPGEYINCFQIHECGNWETEHYYSVLKITRPRSFLFMGIHESEPDIGFSAALICSVEGHTLIPTTTQNCDLYFSGSMEPKVLWLMSSIKRSCYTTESPPPLVCRDLATPSSLVKVNIL